MGFQMKYRVLLLFLVLAMVATSTSCVVADKEVDNDFEIKCDVKWGKEFEKRSLRGFGTVGGKFIDFKDGSSLLKISAESSEKASLIMASYLTGLYGTGDVENKELIIGGVKVSANIIKNQGVTTAALIGKTVLVLTSKDILSLSEIIGSGKYFDASAAKFTTDTEIPTYLQSWEKYPFRFYYRSGMLPKGDKPETHDYKADLDYAAKNELGLSVHLYENMTDLGEGLNNDNWNIWSKRMAEDRNVPTVLTPWSGATTWLFNRYRKQTMQKMPDYCGAFHSIADPYLGGNGKLSWTSTTAKDTELSLISKALKRYAVKPNVMEVMEPHGELAHGAYDVFLEYGEEADKSYRKYLKKTYPSVAKLSQEWYGDSSTVTSWDQVRIPELASFLGYGEKSLSLKGEWKFKYEKLKDSTLDYKKLGRLYHDTVETYGAPDDWFKVNFDDRNWGEVTAPGHDRTMFLNKQPAVYRRSFKVSSELVKNDKIWFYLWDLNMGKARVDKIKVYLNGKLVIVDPVKHNTPHWLAVECREFLKEGENHISLRVPKGYLGYKVYFSPKEPVQYPNLGTLMNTQWVDFCNWRRSTRIDMVKRGIGAVRKISPNKSIYCMAPGIYSTGIKEICERYGARFHNTGYMGAFWAEDLPMLMRSSDLPFSLEPGAPAKDLPGFKKQMGFYLTEGINAIHYFIHIGCITWDSEIKNYFDTIMPAVKMLGKSRLPKSEVAMMMSDKQRSLASYPWGKDYNTNFPAGYMSWKYNEYLLNDYQFDGVNEYDFESGNVNAYKVIVDTNTSIMTKRTVSDIESWVKKGGVFITFLQTARHTMTENDVWGLSDLSGYKVVGISKYDKKGSPEKKMELVFNPDQNVFNTDEWKRKVKAGGLSLEAQSGDCQDLVKWSNGKTAVGMRKVGKGYVVTMGSHFVRDRMWRGDYRSSVKMIRQLLENFKVEKVPAYGKYDNNLIVRHTVTNNGLYDIWTVHNRSNSNALTTDLTFRNGFEPQAMKDLLTGEEVSLVKDEESYKIPNIVLEPLGVRVFSSRKDRADVASLEWFSVLRNWWRGTEKVESNLPALETPNTLDLVSDWSYKALKAEENIDGMVAVAFDDSAWNKRELSPWVVGEEIDSNRVIFRKEFTIPSNWNNGNIYFWLRSWSGNTHRGSIKMWLDGKALPKIADNRGVDGADFTNKLEAGKRYHLAIVISSKGQIAGPKGSVFLSYIPNPQHKQSLAGKWNSSSNAISYDKTLELPGKWKGWQARRTVQVKPEYKGSDVYINFISDPSIIGVLINGTWLRRHHHMLGDVTHLNITPWVKFGEINEIELVRWNGPGNGRVDELNLYYY